jgi:hypothetical protein
VEWIARFRADKWKAARDYGQEMYDGMAGICGYNPRQLM